ncbi:MAG: glycerophosphodiester phosphodiesterase [Chloroflexi bacterium]|nr:glycerophosphodiester phosphodiesterase [Chloroflexota bacterium]
MNLPPLFVVAHRAGNSIAELNTAEAAGADIVEADVWARHGALEVRHLKTMGPIPILWDRWKLSPGWTRRLSLAEIVRAARPATELLLDLKGTDPLLPAMVVETMEKEAPGRPYAVCSRNWDLLEEFRHYPAVRALHSVGSPAQLRTVWGRLTWHDNHAISIHRRLLSAAAVAALKEKASAVVTWPINTVGHLEEVAGWGVDGVTTDSLALLRAVHAFRTAPPPRLLN